MKFYPYKKVGAEKVLAMLKGGGGPHKVFGEFEVLAILKRERGAKSFHSLKGGRKMFYPVLMGGAKSSHPRFSHN